jgi:hypothetical protein
MYVSGTISDFESRLHQLGTDNTALSSFKVEASGYWNTINANQKIKWQKEAQYCRFRLSRNGNDLVTPYF